MTQETRQIMTRELNEIWDTRNEIACFITKNILANFTTREIGFIANAIKEGSWERLLQLIKR